MEDLKQLMRKNYITYASYVILERAIPAALDGLKPVQRRILHALKEMNDGKLHKVANVVGQTMAYHPHGDAAIYEALVNLANKGYLLDRQGNFGNLYTGDPASAARYIETRLSSLALDYLFGEHITEYTLSYDGRKKEPLCLPARLPMLLLHGAEGIAVGMSTKILPHNFVEVLEAEIAWLENKPFELYPDFPTGGYVDVSEYDGGNGKVRVRAKIETPDDKTIKITELPFGVTTDSLIASIEEAARKGVIKIDSIFDYTAQHVEIEIKLPRGQYSSQLVKSLYAFTQAEVTIHTQMIVIHENMPKEATAEQLVKWHAQYLLDLLDKELLHEREKLAAFVYSKTLERIFIENKLYRDLENVKKEDMLLLCVADSLKPFHKELSRKPVQTDLEKLLAIPVRRISRFDLDENKEAIAKAEARVEEIDKHRKRLKPYAVSYLKKILKAHGKDHERKTEITELDTVKAKAVDNRKVKMSIDYKGGFVGTKVQGDETLEVGVHDKLLIFFEKGAYQVIPICEKQYIADEEKGFPIWMGKIDPEEVFTVVYDKAGKKGTYGKRFKVEKFLAGKIYSYIPEGDRLRDFQVGDCEVQIEIDPKARVKEHKKTFSTEEILVKGVSAKGIRLTDKPVKRVKMLLPE